MSTQKKKVQKKIILKIYKRLKKKMPKIKNQKLKKICQKKNS